MLSVGNAGDGGTVAVTGANLFVGSVFSDSGQANAGDITLTASGDLGFIDVHAQGSTGNGGNIAVSGVNIDGNRLRTRTTGDAATDQAGSIDVTATGTVGQSTPIRLDARALDNGIGGAITLNAAGNVQLGAVQSRGGEFSGGDGGAISLTSTGGSITSEEIVSTSFFGSGGNITVDADTTVTIDGDDDLGSTTDGTLNSSTLGTAAGNNGGNISVTAGGDFTLQNLFDPSNLIIDSSTNGGAGGSITINSADWVTFGVSPNLLSVGNAGDGGTVAVTGANLFVGSVFSDSGQANAGDITLTASGDLGFIDVHAQGSTGNGGDIAVSGVNIDGNRLRTRTTGDAATDQAGSIDVTATGTVGQSTPIRLDARALDNGIGGAITLNAAGNVQLGAVQSRGGNVSGGDGGAISLTSTGGSITSEEIVSTSFFGSGGNITVDADTTVTIDGDDDIGSTTDGTLNSSTQGTAVGNNGGNISVTAGGDFTLQNLFDPSNLIIDSSTSGGAGGSITIDTADWVTFGVSPLVFAFGNNGDGGTINISGGDVLLGDVASESGLANAGDISLSATGDLAFNDVNAIGFVGDGGDVVLSAVNINGNRVRSRTDGDDLGDQAGLINITTTGNFGQFSPISLDSRARNNGIGGSITTNISGDASFDSVRSTAGTVTGGDAGTISITVSGTAQFTDIVDATSSHGNGGTVSLSGGAVDIQNTVTSNGTSDIQLTATSGDLDFNNAITSGGDIVLSATGDIVQSPVGTLTAGGTFTAAASVFFVNDQLNANYVVPAATTLGGSGLVNGSVSVQSGGTVAPGNSPGILNTGNFDLLSGSTLEIEIGGVNAGNTASDHDQVNVTGTVTLAGTLNTLQFNGFNPTSGDQFTIINNDLSDAVSGTFAGLAEGATISNFLGSGLAATITYVGGDGNDVVLTAFAPTSVSLSSGNLLIEDTDNNTDTLEIQASGTDFQITDTTGNILRTSIVGASGDGTSTITVPFSSVTGTQVIVNTGGGDDSITIGSSFAPENSTGATSTSFRFAGRW